MTRFYRIAFSSMELDGKLAPGDPLWSRFNASFQSAELQPASMAYMIDDGRAFTTCLKKQWRTSENFLCGQHLGLDFDSLSVEQALAEPFVEKYAALLYHTPSSTPSCPRCRAVFLLDTPITQAANYVRAATALIWSFGGQADRMCKDAARFFYGALGSMPLRRDRELPLAIVRDMIAAHEALLQNAPRRSAAPAYAGKAIAGALDFASHAPEGERNNSLYWAARRWQERGVPQAEAETMAAAVGRASGLTEAETTATVRSAYRSR